MFLLTFEVDVSMKTVGGPEGTGFTHAYNVEPITFIPGDAHKNDRPVSIYNLLTILFIHFLFLPNGNFMKRGDNFKFFFHFCLHFYLENMITKLKLS